MSPNEIAIEAANEIVNEVILKKAVLPIALVDLDNVADEIARIIYEHIA